MFQMALALSLWMAVFTAVGFVPETAVAESAGVLNIRLQNGIHARIFTSGYLAARTVINSSEGELQLDTGESLTLVTDINDPLIVNKGDGQFHPFDTGLVIATLDEIVCPGKNLDVDVFILPYPRSNVLSSSASGQRVYLSPQVLKISKEGAAYIIAHELGHVFQYRHLPDPLQHRWDEYRRIRGIEDETRFSNLGPHSYRPHEIFAEDFRVLFGGFAAYFGGRVENPEISAPMTVSGLKEFFFRLATGTSDIPVIVSFGNYPNPFNPQTELRIHLSTDFPATGERVTVRIYDVTGALVRELYAGHPTGPNMRVMWDGSDRNGRQVASSTYFGVVEAGDARMTTKLLMIK